MNRWVHDMGGVRGQLAAHRHEHESALRESDAAITCRCTRPMPEHHTCVKCGRLTAQALNRKRCIGGDPEALSLGKNGRPPAWSLSLGGGPGA
jgi:hypothetical protein